MMDNNNQKVKRERSLAGSILVFVLFVLTVAYATVHWMLERSYGVISLIPACLCIPLGLAAAIFPLPSFLYKSLGFLLGLLAFNGTLIDLDLTFHFGIQFLLVIAYIYDMFVAFMALVYMATTNRMLTRLQAFPMTSKSTIGYPVVMGYQPDAMDMYPPPPPPHMMNMYSSMMPTGSPYPSAPPPSYKNEKN